MKSVDIALTNRDRADFAGNAFAESADRAITELRCLRVVLDGCQREFAERFASNDADIAWGRLMFGLLSKVIGEDGPGACGVFSSAVDVVEAALRWADAERAAVAEEARH